MHEENHNKTQKSKIRNQHIFKNCYIHLSLVIQNVFITEITDPIEFESLIIFLKTSFELF